ncbi:MAG: YtxH domain-containing protein [Smithellaceae bacterium]|nr:YtxH domain-containing protein [Smithellaceae bacterium]
MSTRTGDFIKGVIIGGALGALLGFLYAPKSGKETREDLAKGADELMAKAKKEYERSLERSKKIYEEAMQRAQEMAETAKQVAAGAGDKIEEIAAFGKETVEENKNRLKRALDAGIEAFREEKHKTE